MALKHRIAVVGLGSIGRRHARLLAQREDVEVEWCESDVSALAVATAELGRPTRIHASFADLLSSRPERIVIATPHGLHAAQTVAALQAGAHVLCEKPMADTLAAASSMHRAQAESGRVLTFGFQLHFNPGLRRLRQIITDGELGAIVHLHCHVGSYITLVNSRSRYQSRVEGSLLMDYTHQPDLLQWIVGAPPVGVYALGGQAGAMEFTSNPNYINLSCDYARPFISTIHLNYLQMPERHHYEIVGDQGWATYNFNTGQLRRGRRDDSREWTEEFPTERDPMYIAEHTAFLDAVAGRRAPESPARDAIVSMQIIEAALASWRSGRREPLPALPA